MPRPESLRLRTKLIAEFEQLAERLEHGDATSIEEAQDRLYGIALTEDCDILALVFRALLRVLDDMQSKVDESGVKWSSDDRNSE